MAEKLTSKQLLAKLTAQHYAEAKAAKEKGELVAWSASIAPQELCETMGITVLYPENHAAAVGAKGGGLPLLEHAEALGYSIDICSYARISMGYADLQDCIFENIPLPDLVICCNNICNTLIKWYENLARELNVPLIMIDIPYNHQYEVSQARVDYIKAQLLEAINQLETICNRPFDWERFNEVTEISVRAAKSWRKAMDLALHTPSPLSGFNIFNYMALIVCMRGREESVQLFDLIAEELEELAANNASQFPEKEEFRVMWEGIACWPYLSHNFKTLRKYGMNMVGSTYPDAWTLIYEPGDLEGMARAYASTMNSRNLDYGIGLRTNIINDYACDGALYHMNRSCKLMDLMQYRLQAEVYKNTSVPYVVFDGDQTDPRNFSAAQFETRVQALAEMMQRNKKLKDKLGGE